MSVLHRPSSVVEVTEILRAHPDATLIAGGTDLMVEVNSGSREVGDVVSLRGVAPQLAGISAEFIGAMATWSQLLSQAPYSSMREAARAVGSPQIRNMGTLGGNIATASPAGDGLPVLSALRASVHLASTRGLRVVTIGEFLVGPKAHDGATDEVIVGVEVPKGAEANPQSFMKIGRRGAMVISQVSACAVLWEDELRLAFGSVGPTVIEVTLGADSIDRLRRRAPDDLHRLVVRCRDMVAPITDQRASRSYRLHAVGVLAQRLVDRVLA
jgi:CO/xanthine dehydrogenase FAD-binding subunit